jgi:hypothetical protein
MVMGCGLNPLDPEAGMSVPKDPGTLVVRVEDQASLPVQDVYVSVVEPNSIGSLFNTAAWTTASGTITFYGVPAGSRRVAIAPPTGFSVDAASSVRQVDVVRGALVTVDFNVVRK